MGQFKITYPCDLCCDSFDALFTPICRWRNEWTICGPGDDMDWVRAKYPWGVLEGRTIFGTNKTASGYYIITGTTRKLHPEFSAMLVGDPVQCQQGDGVLTFRYWTSPSVKVRACVRKPGAGKIYEWCSNDYTTGDPGPANITIPGSILYTFELVIEARNFDFDAFGLQGGVCIIDDITYNAPAVYNCKNLPHLEPFVELPKETCETIQCTFDEGACLQRMSDSGWKIASGSVGNYHTGIRKALAGQYAYARGPGTKSFSLGKFKINREAELEFCFYRAIRKARLGVYLSWIESENRTKIYESDEIDSNPHEWICDGVRLNNGEYESIEFVAEKLLNEYSYIAVDQIGLADPLQGVSMCMKQLVDNSIQLTKGFYAKTKRIG
ncbi:unnamed protein product [Toxocara canis]|uniref:MAM domain-containing protein n=1 Tax=Toxocara canis TaxID=6265 RepID=A0A3P7IQG2_TOXCA|nr:unnamed protein product [Toxocara canis]